MEVGAVMTAILDTPNSEPFQIVGCSAEALTRLLPRVVDLEAADVQRLLDVFVPQLQVCVENTDRTRQNVAVAVLSILERYPDIELDARVVRELLQTVEARPIELGRGRLLGIIAKFWRAEMVEFQPVADEDVADLTGSFEDG
jgi:hypothetical protein